MVNWTFIYNNYERRRTRGRRQGHRLGRYPQTVEGEESAPPYGGIGIGVSEYSSHEDEAIEAAECLTSPENQGVNAELDRQHAVAARPVTRTPALTEDLPGGPARPVPAERRRGGPRAVSPYWSDISGALQSRWHPPASVDPDHARGVAQTFIEDVLQRKEPAVTSTVGAAPPTAQGTRPRQPTSDRSQRPRTGSGSKLVAPAVVVMLLVTAWPMLQALYLSLFRYRLTAPDDKEFVGLEQLRHRADGRAVLAGHLNTVLIMVVTVAVELVIGFAFAMVMHRIIFARGVDPHLDPDPLRHHHRGLGVRLAVHVQHQQRLRQRWFAWLPWIARTPTGSATTGRRCSRSWSRRSGRPRRSCRCCCWPVCRRSPRT